MNFGENVLSYIGVKIIVYRKWLIFLTIVLLLFMSLFMDTKTIYIYEFDGNTIINPFSIFLINFLYMFEQIFFLISMYIISDWFTNWSHVKQIDKDIKKLEKL